MSYAILFLTLFLINHINGQIYYGYANYTEFHMGNMNILISIPHDGTLKPANIPDRTEGISDYNTRKLGLGVRDELINLFKTQNKKPFVVINNLHRIKLDPNRDTIECCTGTDNDAYVAYSDYHNFIKTRFEQDFMIANLRGYRQGLVIDIHGQSHPEDWIELGYLLGRSDYEKPMLLTPSYSSLRLLTSQSQYRFEEIIRGSVSLGGILQKNNNHKAVPSPAYQSPGSTGNYYNGGFITRTYGSVNCKTSRVNAIQIESPYPLRDNAKVTTYAKQLAKAIYDFYLLHKLDQTYESPLLTNDQVLIDINTMLLKCQYTK